MTKDWTGNKNFINTTNSRNLSSEENDFYATDPKAIDDLSTSNKKTLTSISER